jgi:hypothetical protein
MKGCEDMNSDQLLGVVNALASISITLTEAVLEKDQSVKDMTIALARQEIALIQKTILEHATQEFMKETGV